MNEQEKHDTIFLQIDESPEITWCRDQIHDSDVEYLLASPPRKAVALERKRQTEKWGEQNHDVFVWLSILSEEIGELAQAALHDKFGGRAAGTLKNELTQVAAVAVQWLEQLERDKHVDHE